MRRPRRWRRTIGELARALNAGEVGTLVILGGNPVYNAPAELDWAATQRKAKLVVRLGCLRGRDLRAERLEHSRGCIIWSRGATRAPATARWCRFSR